MTSPTLYIEITTGQLTHGLGGLPAGPLVFTQNDVNGLQVGFSNGGVECGAALTAAGTATITWAVLAAAGGTLLAGGSVASGYWADPLATIPVALTTPAMAAYFASNVPGDKGRFLLEITVSLAGQVVAYLHDRATVYASLCTPAGGGLFGGVVLAFSSAAQLVALATVGQTPTTTFLWGTINGALVGVQLITGSQSTGGGYYQPADHAASGFVWQQLY